MILPAPQCGRPAMAHPYFSKSVELGKNKLDKKDKKSGGRPGKSNAKSLRISAEAFQRRCYAAFPIKRIRMVATSARVA